VISAAFLLAVLPASALGQATRTWVSGNGDDANPCSRTAPCKSFAGAITKTAASGEIDALDSGGFGAVTINKSLTISGEGVTAGVLVAGTNAITVSAAPTDRVTVRGLDINGLGSASTSLSGVRVNTAASVRVESTSIYGFTVAGIDFEPTNPGARLIVTDTSIHDNTGNGVLGAPGVGGDGTITLRNVSVDSNACGLVATTLGTGAGTCGTSASGTPGGGVQINSANVAASNNTGAGVLSNGTGASNVILSDLITGNGVGLQTLNGGTITSRGGNQVYANTTDGAPTSDQTPPGPGNIPGPAGPTGPAGPRGFGGVGLPGPAGPTGANGRVQLVTCRTVVRTVRKKGKRRKVKRLQCTGKLVSGPVRFNAASGPRATLARGGHVLAVGNQQGGRVVLYSSRRLGRGRYTLRVFRGKRVVRRQTVAV
jgi:hypothetical protein